MAIAMKGLRLKPKYEELINVAVSDNDKIVKFDIKTSQYWSYLSKGGKIGDKGFDTKAIKLDSLKISKPDLQIKAIKIDTEGEDLKVLQGARNLISNHKPKIIIETRKNNIEEIINFLRNLGYENIYDAESLRSQDKNLINFKDNQSSKDIFFEYRKN